MKTYTIFLLICAAFLLMASPLRSQIKKYDIKSGIVKYDLIMKVSKMEIKKKTIVYFDDYGMKECRETYSNDNKLEQTYFSDGKNLFSVNHAKKTVHKQGEAFRGTELRVEFTDFGTEKDRQEGKIKKMPAMSIAGKNCESFGSDDGKGTVTVYGGWNKILMYMHVKSKSVETIQKANKVEENAKVSEDKFKIPAGFTVQ
jgi:outer membrane lipoprotein-sorting protein